MKTKLILEIISKNVIGFKGAEKLSEAISKLQILTYLNLNVR
jgi:hypothetical protein